MNAITKPLHNLAEMHIAVAETMDELCEMALSEIVRRAAAAGWTFEFGGAPLTASQFERRVSEGRAAIGVRPS